VAQIGALYAADAWNNITFTAGEVRNPARNIPLSLTLGTGIVIVLYVLANFAYVVVLPFSEVQHAPADRVASAMMQPIFPSVGASLIAVAIMIAAFGCMNGMILSGARAYYAMALDGVFFRPAAVLNQAHVPSKGLLMQGIWAVVLLSIRTYDREIRESLQQPARLHHFRGADFLHSDYSGSVSASRNKAQRRKTVQSIRLSAGACAVSDMRDGDFVRSICLPYRDHHSGRDHRTDWRAGLFRVQVCGGPARSFFGIPSAVAFHFNSTEKKIW
jgi:hypothetical protein